MHSTGILLSLFAVYTSPTRNFLPAAYIFNLYNPSSENLCAFSAIFLPPGKLYLFCGQCSPQEFFYPFSVSLPPPQEISFRLCTFSSFITLPVRIYVPFQQIFSLRGNCTFPVATTLPGDSLVPSHSASIFSINIPYPLVGSSTNTWVTAPMILPS